MYLIPPAQAERFPKPYGDETWGSVFGAIGMLARASATVRAVIPNSRTAIGELEDACHARYQAATGRTVPSQSDRILAWAIARIDHPEGDLDDAHVFGCYDDMVTRRRRPEGEPLVPLVPVTAELRTVLDLGNGMRWAAINDVAQAIAVGHVANCDLATSERFHDASTVEGRVVYALTNVGPSIEEIAAIAFTPTIPDGRFSVQDMARQGVDPWERHAEAIQALSGHLGVEFARPPRSRDAAPARKERSSKRYDAPSQSEARRAEADAGPSVAPDEWLPLAQPFTAANGHVVEVVSSQAVLQEIGTTFRNALGNAGYRNGIVLDIERGRRQIYRTLRDGVMQSCGELVVTGGVVSVEYDRAKDNAHGTEESKAAVGAFASAINDGSVEVAYAIGEDGFVTRQPGSTPGP